VRGVVSFAREVGEVGGVIGSTMIVDVRINMRNVLESLCLPWLCGVVR
jgi:hypothetical protein